MISIVLTTASTIFTAIQQLLLSRPKLPSEEDEEEAGRSNISDLIGTVVNLDDVDLESVNLESGDENENNYDDKR